jgi:hypothetical protein
LLKRADQVRVGDILCLTEGPLLGPETDSEEPLVAKGAALACQRVTDGVFADLGEQLRACFNAVTLDDICRRAEEQGLRRPNAERLVYVI